MNTKITVALADDHAIVRNGLLSILANYNTLQIVADADNGKELIEKIEVLNAPPDVVILDINMPIMNGYDTTRHLLERWPTCKVLALSMFDDEECVIRMLRCGANGYLLKDTSPKDLLKAITHLKTNQYYYTDKVTGRLLNIAHTPDINKKDMTDREVEFLSLCCKELTYKEIAEKMCVSPRTVDGYRENLFKKLNTPSRVGLIIYAIKTGLVNA